MQYFGGKQRIAKKLADAIQPYINQRGIYVEPFVGGAAVMSIIKAPIRIGADSNIALINMWQELSDGWEPPSEVSEEMYSRVKEHKDQGDPLTAFIGFGCSFAGKWFGGYARGRKDRNYAKNARSSLKRKLKGLINVQWVACDYRQIQIPKGAVIYCDPPYAGTTQYGAVEPFVWSEFWNWCTARFNAGNIIFISEYTAPPTFREFMVIPTKTDIRTKKNGKEERVEKLFVPKYFGR